MSFIENLQGMLNEFGNPSVPKPPKTTNMIKVAADWKDIEGLVDQLKEYLPALGLQVQDDPRYAGSDTYGLIISRSPVSQQQIKKEFYS